MLKPGPAGIAGPGPRPRCPLLDRRNFPIPGKLTSVEPVRKSVTVPAAPQRAFELFTGHIQEWWPLGTHSVGAEHAVGVAFGEGVGAAIIETLADGTTSV